MPENDQLFVRKGVNIGRPCKTYAVNEEADYYSDNLYIVDSWMMFDFHAGEQTVEFAWQIPGTHNVENATAAIAVLYNLGADLQHYKKGFLVSKELKTLYQTYF